MIDVELLNNSYFFIPTVLHLTFESPGPIEIDPDKLSEQQKKWLLTGAASNQIRLTRKDGSVIDPIAKPVAKPAVSIVVDNRDQATAILEKAEAAREILKKNATILLDGQIAAVVKRISSVKDIALLKLCSTLEKRPKVTAALSEQIKVLELEIAAIVGEDLKPKDLVYAETGPSYSVTEEVD